MSDAVTKTKGLEGVIIGDSAICTIDGEKGTLSYRGIDINDLARNSTFEETTYLLWFNELPTRRQLDEFKARLAAEREIHDAVWKMLISFPCWPQPMEALRTAVSALSSCDPEADNNDQDENVRKAIALMAKMPTILAYYYRHSEGLERVHPDPTLSHAGNFLYMMRGERPSPTEERALDLALILMAEHELNASTFAARVTASTLSDMYSAITTAIGTLKGPLHGGANERAMEMLLDIGDESRVGPWIEDALADRKRIMGFGHRVYKTTDPRALLGREMVCELDSKARDPRWCSLAMKVVEAVEERKKGIFPNVDFFTAPLLYTLGIPMHLDTAIFALSRIAGWGAHVMEQYADNRLIRPQSRYVGQLNRPYVPIDER